VLNRLCDPDSKLGVLRWLETISLPGVIHEAIEHQHLLRAIDALMEHREAVDTLVAELLRPLIDQTLSVVFYAMTTIHAKGLSEQQDDVRQYRLTKEGVIARQFMLGVVQTSDGMPLYHEVFDGNTVEVTTLKPTIEKVLDEQKLTHARLIEGKLLLVTNVADLTPPQILKRNKSLADIERGFRVLKSEIEIGPVYHRLPERIRAHAMICFIALVPEFDSSPLKIVVFNLLPT
jgi:hypothetical protein